MSGAFTLFGVESLAYEKASHFDARGPLKGGCCRAILAKDAEGQQFRITFVSDDERKLRILDEAVALFEKAVEAMTGDKPRVPEGVVPEVLI